MYLALNLPPRLERLKLSRALAFDDHALQCLSRVPAGALTALDVGSQRITDAAIPSLQRLALAGLQSLTLWHSTVSRDAVESLIASTGLALDTSMRSSAGTYLLARPAVAVGDGAR